MPDIKYIKSIDAAGTEILTYCTEKTPKKRRAKIAKLLDIKVRTDALGNCPLFTETEAIITDPEEQKKRAEMTRKLRGHILEQNMEVRPKGQELPGMIQRTGSLRYYFRLIGDRETLERFDRVMPLSKESRQEQIWRLRTEGMSKEDAEKMTDSQRKQAALARGNMLGELAYQFKDTTEEALLNSSDEDIVNLYPLISYLGSLSLNFDDLYKNQAGDILLTDEARRLCQHLSGLMGAFSKLMKRAELIFSPYYAYLDQEKLSAKCQENVEEFYERFSELGDGNPYLGIYGQMIGQLEIPLGNPPERKDYRDGLCEKIKEQAAQKGMDTDDLVYKKQNGTELEYGAAGLGQYLYEGETVLVTDGAKELEVTFRKGEPKVKVRENEKENENKDISVKEVRKDFEGKVRHYGVEYVNPGLKKRLGEVVDAVSDADPMLMISSPQYREMKAKLNEFAEVYKHTEGDFALKNPDKVREQQKLLCELLLKSTAYLRYKGTKSQKESEKRRIKAAQSIRKFAKRQLLVLDDLNDHCKDLEAALNAERECRRPFNEAGRKMARGFRLSKESDNTITVGKELEAAFADDEEKSIYTRLDLGNPQKEKKRLSAEDKKVVKGLLENLVIRRIIREEQNSAIFDQFKAYRNTLYGSFELVAKMRPLETLKGIIEKTGIINRHLNEMTYEDVTKLIEGKMSRDRSVAAISDDVYVSARDAVLDEKKKIRREMKESGNGTENGNRTGNAKKMGTMEAGSARKSS